MTGTIYAEDDIVSFGDFVFTRSGQSTSLPVTVAPDPTGDNTFWNRVGGRIVEGTISVISSGGTYTLVPTRGNLSLIHI